MRNPDLPISPLSPRVLEIEERSVDWETLRVDPLSEDAVSEGGRVLRVDRGEVGFGLEVSEHDLSDGGGGGGRTGEGEGGVDNVGHAGGDGRVDGEFVDLEIER